MIKEIVSLGGEATGHFCSPCTSLSVYLKFFIKHI